MRESRVMQNGFKVYPSNKQQMRVLEDQFIIKSTNKSIFNETGEEEIVPHFIAKSGVVKQGPDRN